MHDTYNINIYVYIHRHNSMVYKEDKKMDKYDIIIFLSILPILILIFIKHDEFLMLFLIELGFMIIIGLIYVLITVIAIYIAEKISRRKDK